MDGNSAPERIGPYRILDLLGEGGSGKVYLAQSSPDEPPVALKVLHDPTRELLERFRREAELMAGLEHPFIARFVEAELSPESGPPYIVTECIIGRHLDEVVEEEKLSAERILDLLIHVCEGLSCAHRAGFLHRDIKPSNILVDGSLCPKLIDFGLAKPMAPEGTGPDEAGELGPPGTLAYMSPEQLEGTTPIDQRSDVYSLGAVAYALFSRTQRAPHGDVDNPVHYLTRKLRNDPPKLAAVQTEMSTKLSDVIARAVRVKRSRRYRSIDGLRRDLQACRDKRWTGIQKRRWTTVLLPIVIAAIGIAVFSSNKSFSRLEAALRSETFAREEAVRELRGFMSAEQGKFVFGEVNVDFEKCAFAFPPGYQITMTLDAGVDYTDYIKFRIAEGVITEDGRILDGSTVPRRDPPGGPFVDVGSFGAEHPKVEPVASIKVFRTPKPVKVSVEDKNGDFHPIEKTLPLYVMYELRTIGLAQDKDFLEYPVRIKRMLPNGNGVELDTGIADFFATIEWRRY